MIQPTSDVSGSEYPDVTLARELADVLNTSRLTKIELNNGARKITLARDARVLSAPMFSAACSTNIPATEPARANHVISLTQPASVNSETLVAPIVGTAYRGREANAVPLVSVGQRFSAGDTLLIIEAMKIKNPVVAHRNGTIVDVLVNDGQPVEYGQPLIVVE